MRKLRWLQVNKFRSVKPGMRLTCNSGYNVLLGQNGTGKTTLLNLVAAAVSLDFSHILAEEFDLEYELATDEATAIISLRNYRRAQQMPSGFTELSYKALQIGGLISEGALHATTLSVEVTVSAKKSSIQLRLSIEGRHGLAQRTDQRTPSPPIKLDFQDFPEITSIRQTLVLGLAQCSMDLSLSPEEAGSLFVPFLGPSQTRFDESLQYFEELGKRVAVLTRDNNSSVVSIGQPTGPILNGLIGSAQKKWGEDRYTLTDADLSFLKRTIELLDFESAEAVIALKSSTISDVFDTMQLGELKFYLRHRGGWKISEEQLSYGQKRMLAFLHYMDGIDSTVIADELVNGLHHRWIRACIELMGQRQVFLTSQNPLLLDYLTFQSPEEVRSTFVLCSWEKGPEQMVWQNMSPEAAEDFFDSYRVRFQQVGELLQTKGLW